MNNFPTSFDAPTLMSAIKSFTRNSHSSADIRKQILVNLKEATDRYKSVRKDYLEAQAEYEQARQFAKSMLGDDNVADDFCTARDPEIKDLLRSVSDSLRDESSDEDEHIIDRIASLRANNVSGLTDELKAQYINDMASDLFHGEVPAMEEGRKAFVDHYVTPARQAGLDDLAMELLALYENHNSDLASPQDTQ